MDLRVSEDIKEISNVLTEVRYLIKDVLLPEIFKTQEELKALRRITWPVCQSIKETSQISDISGKIEFLNGLEHDEIIKLLKNKNDFSKDDRISKSTCHLLVEEVKRIIL